MTKSTLTKSVQMKAVKASTYIIQIDKIHKARENYEQKELARSNQCLYAILADVLRTYEKLSEDKAVMKQTIDVLTQRIAAGGGRVQANSPVLGTLVRYVFNPKQRQATHIYVRAIQAAIKSNVTADGLVDFITKAGGVDGCMKQATPSTKTNIKAEKIKKTMPLVEEMLKGEPATVLGEVTVPARFVQKTYTDGCVFLMGKSDVNGKVKVFSAVPANSTSMTKWAKEQLAIFLYDEGQINQQKVKSKKKDAAIDEAVKAVKKPKPKSAKTIVVDAVAA